MIASLFPIGLPGVSVRLMRSTEYRTEVFESPGGVESRYSFRSVPKRRYSVAVEFLRDTDDERALLQSLFDSAAGALSSFLLVDPVDGVIRVVRFADDALPIPREVAGIWRADTELETCDGAYVVSIDVTPASVSKAAGGQTQQYAATATLADSSTVVVTAATAWQSSNTSRATINAAGLATTGAQTGAVVITGTLGTVSDTADLTVT